MVLSFSLAASSIYLVNDIADYERDRVHPKKRFRPIASGQISRVGAGIFGACIAPIGWYCAWLLNPALRRGPLHDHESGIFNLFETCRVTGCVYHRRLSRVCAGAFDQVKVSPWMIMCTFFVASFSRFVNDDTSSKVWEQTLLNIEVS